jgi:hypothetical protein
LTAIPCVLSLSKNKSYKHINISKKKKYERFNSCRWLWY